MKTITKKILVVALMLGTLTSYANINLDVTPTNEIIKRGDLVSIYDEDGTLVYSDKMENNGNVRTMFDFSNLKDGIYTIEINKAFEIFINRFEIADRNVRFLEAERKIIHKPVFRTEKNKVLISKLALDSNEMKVELYFENDLIHSERIDGEAVIKRVYQLDMEEQGEYKAVIKSNGRVYIENFRI